MAPDALELALRNAVANVKILVRASVSTCGPVITAYTGAKPSATASPDSGVLLLSKMSQRISPTEASENQPWLFAESVSRLKPKSSLMPEEESRYCGSPR